MKRPTKYEAQQWRNYNILSVIFRTDEVQVSDFPKGSAKLFIIYTTNNDVEKNPKAGNPNVTSTQQKLTLNKDATNIT